MKKSFIIPLILFICLQSVSAQQWLNKINGTANSRDIAKSVVSDTLGNTFVTGYLTNAITGKDIFVVKYNSGGSQIWTAGYNGTSQDEAYVITLDSFGNSYVTGYTTSPSTGKNIITIKFNSAGIKVWQQIYTGIGNYSDEAYAITLDAVGNVYVTGYSVSAALGKEVIILSYTANGEPRWIQKYNVIPGNVTDEAYTITLDQFGNVIVTGITGVNNNDILTAKFSNGGSLIWSQTFNGPANYSDEAYAITLDNAGNIYVTGHSSDLNEDDMIINKDFTTISYTSNGTRRWVSYYDYNHMDDISRSIITAYDGSIIAAGSSVGNGTSEDYLIIKYNPANGGIMFNTRYNGSSTGRDIAYCLVSSPEHIFAAGTSQRNTGNFDPDVVTLAIDYSGVIKKDTRILNSGEDAAYSIVTAETKSEVFVAGFMSSDQADYDFAEAKFSKNSLISVELISAGIPVGFALHQNYPNPFNPSTTIKFEVSEQGNIRISVFDITGREVYTAVDRYLRPGIYEVTMGTDELSSGIYYYKMTAGDFVQTRKMVLIK